MGAGLMHVHAPNRGWPPAARVTPSGAQRVDPVRDEHLARYLADVADAAGPDDELEVAGRRPPVVPSAVVWINGRGALVARVDEDGEIVTSTVDGASDEGPLFLSRVVRAIGDRERIMILGPGSARLALEREYVDIHRRPDHLVDVEPTGLVEEPDLVDRLRRLAA
jgi:hypothetical protein